MAQRRQAYREVVTADLAGGLNDSTNEAVLDPSESPACENVDFDSNAIETARGSIPFNRQSAPGTSILTKVDPALTPLGVSPSPIGGTGTGAVGVPLRGYCYFPYAVETDIGGDFASEGDFLASPQTFHNRRGRSFELNVTVEIPTTEKLYEAESRGSGAPAVGAEAAGFSGYDFDEAVDECMIVLQKGGDKLQCMSWALGIVNVGAARGLDSFGQSRESNYALCFMWFDGPEFGETDPVTMKYNLTTGQNPVGGAASQFSTMAYRAVLIHNYMDPGERYSVAVQLKIDSGSPGAAATNTAWVGDGSFKVTVGEEGSPAVARFTATDSAGGAMTVAGMQVIRGPSDSLQYLCRYGIRFSGRDPMYAGLGMRFIPWQPCGFIPFGQDDTPLKNGGFQMVDRSSTTVATLYGGGIHTLTATHNATDAYVTLNHQGFVVGNTNGGANPWGVDTGGGVYTRWKGLGAGTVANANLHALDGYKLVLTTDATATRRGAVLPIKGYAEVGASYRVDIGWPGATNSSWGPFPVLVQCFRWHQRPLYIGEIRIWSTPRDYDGADSATNGYKRCLSLVGTIEIGDVTEPDIANLLAYWPMSDAEGSTLKELMVGGSRNGFLCPFGLGTTNGGARGDTMLFVSGEGEAPCIDFSENPVIQRELQNMLANATQGFAIELSCVFTEAPYALSQLVTVPDSTIAGQRARFVPTILSWEVKNASASGNASVPRPLITLTHNGVYTDTNGKQFQRPTGFFVEVAHRSDQQDVDPITPSDLLPFFLTAAPANVSRYDLSASWVGKPVTIQIGIQTTGTVDQYDLYIAMTPKDAFFPATGDASDAEFAYWTAGGGSYANPHFSGAHITIAKKDLVRSVVTLGRWNPGTKGYTELQPRMLVDEVRVFSGPAPGALPTTNGGIVSGRNGKLEGPDALPAREVSRDDLLLSLGAGLTTANVTDGSVTVTAPALAKFHTGGAKVSVRATKETLLYVPGDPHKILSEERGLVDTQEELYRIKDVAASGLTLTLDGAYANATRTNAKAYSLRTLAVTSFSEDIRDVLLTLGSGAAFEPGTTTTSDIILTEELWANTAPVVTGWRLRFFSPLGRTSLRDILPSWARGMSITRRNPILGLEGFNDRRIAVAKGSVFEVDDRWRVDGPDDDHRWSLAFRAKPLVGEIREGLQNDRVMFSNGSYSGFTPGTTNEYVTIYDAWVKLDSICQYQTVLWVGNKLTDPMQPAGSTAGKHAVHVIVRFNQGRPQFVFGSTAAYTGTTVPEGGYFVATGSAPIAADRWTHIRWVLQTYTNGATQQLVKVPFLKVNGKRMSVTVNATDVGITGAVAGDWLRASTIVSSSGCGLVLGIARDAYRQPDTALAFNSTNPQGTCFGPQRIQGWMHSLDGRLSEIAISRQPVFSGSEPADFDPFSISYAAASVEIRFHALVDAPGIGHKVEDEPGSQFGVIVSHPFISLWHELGSQDKQASFAEYGQQLYVTNGARVARIGPSSAGLAGVLPPTEKPTVRLERLPLWKPNARNKASSNDPTNGPIDPASAGAALQVDHYDNHGNNYWAQPIAFTPGESEIAWVKDSSNFSRYWAFKAYIRPRDISGRRQLIGRRSGQKKGGPWVEMVDGKLRVGWFDTYLKKDVWVETSAQVFEPGLVHYVYFRKRWPQNDAVEGNWTNSHFSNGDIRRALFTSGKGGTFQVGETVNFTAGGGVAGTAQVIRTYGASADAMEFVLLTGTPGATSAYTGATSGATGTTSVAAIRPMHDSLVVRQMRNDALFPFTATTQQALQAKYDNVTPIRQCVSFTTTALAAPAGTTATGMVSLPGLTFRGNAAGQVLAGTSMPNVEPFHPDMRGMYFQWGSGGTAGSFVGKLYRITNVVSNQVIDTIDESTGTATNFAAVNTNTAGAVFSGISLVKSEGFDSSKAPDAASYPIELFGSSEAADPNSGMLPFDGEWWTPGWTSALSTVANEGTDARVFENVNTSTGGAGTADPIFVGTDWFDFDILDGVAGEPGELHYDDWVAANQVGTWCSVDGRTYAAAGGNDSTQPNVSDYPPSGEREPVVAHDTANPVNSTNALDVAWRYLTPVTDLSGKRFLRTRFFDPDQNEYSDPSPATLVSPASEDSSNPSGLVRAIVSDLPVSRQGPKVSTLVYASLKDGDAATMFKVREVPSGTREVSFPLSDEETAGGAVLDFINGVPPRCEIITEAQARLWYGAVEFQPDGIYISGAGKPVSIDYSQPITRINSGFGPKITMLKGLDGYVVAAKRRALAALQANTDGSVSVRVVSTGVGCVSHQSAVATDERLYWVGEKGLYMALRSGVTDLTKPTYVATKVRHFFLEVLDAAYADRLCAAINRRRSQYVLAGREIDRKHADVRLVAEFDYSAGGSEMSAAAASTHRFGRYRGPNITALASVQASDGGLERLIAGTEEGMVLWMDDPGTQLHGAGALAAVWGFPSVTVGSDTTTQGFASSSSGAFDTTLEGPRGCLVRYRGSTGALQEVTLRGAVSTYALFGDVADEAPVTDTQATVGAQSVSWSTGWLSFGNPHIRKQVHWLDLVTRPEAQGTVQVDIYTDLDGTDVKLTGTVDLTKEEKRFDLGGLEGRYWKAVLSVPVAETATKAQIAGMVWRVVDQDQA